MLNKIKFVRNHFHASSTRNLPVSLMFNLAGNVRVLLSTRNDDVKGDDEIGK